MKLKYYLRGVGIGIIVTVLILFFGQGNSQSTVTPNVNAGEKVSDVQSQNQNKETQSSGEKSSTIAEPSSVAESSSAATGVAEQSSSAASSSAAVEYYRITVERGMFSDTIAKALESVGAVEDAKDFNNYLIKMGYDSQIYVGECVIPKGSSYAEIAKILISKEK